MAMRCETEVQGDLVMTWAEMPRSPGHAFYDRLQKLLNEAGFDAFVEAIEPLEIADHVHAEIAARRQ